MNSAFVNRLSVWADRFGSEVECPVGVGPNPHDIRGAVAYIAELEAEIARLTDALNFAHSEGFEWPADPLPPFSAASELLLERESLARIEAFGHDRETGRDGEATKAGKAPKSSRNHSDTRIA